MKCMQNPGVRFSGRPVTNGAQKWLRATSIFGYSSPHGDSKYLESCIILDPAKISQKCCPGYIAFMLTINSVFVTRLTLQEMLPNRS